MAKADEVDGLLHGLLPESEVFPQALRVPARALRHYLLLPTLLATIISLAALGPTGWLIYRPALPWALVAVVLVALFAAGVRTLEWRRAGVGTDEAAVIFRSGALGSRRVRLTRSRIQSLDVQQSPFQRRAHLASLRTVSVSGSSRATYGVAHLEQAEALRILSWYENGLARPSRLARSTVEFRGAIDPVSRITRTEVVDLADADLAEIHYLRTRAPDFFEEVGDPPPTLESFQADLDDLPDGYSRAPMRRSTARTTTVLSAATGLRVMLRSSVASRRRVGGPSASSSWPRSCAGRGWAAPWWTRSRGTRAPRT